MAHASPAALLDRLREELWLRRRNPRTVRTYVGWISRFLLAHAHRGAAELGPQEVADFLSRRAAAEGWTLATRRQASAALYFFYDEVLGAPLEPDRAARSGSGGTLPVVLTRAEARAVLAALGGSPGLVASLIHDCRLRLSQCVGLRVRDINLINGRVLLHGDRSRKDSSVRLPPRLLAAVDHHLQGVRLQHRADLLAGHGRVALPEALVERWPFAAREWAWQWAFPATRYTIDHATKERRRHHIHPSEVQSALGAAGERLGVKVLVTCELLRRSAVAHASEDPPALRDPFGPRHPWAATPSHQVRHAVNGGPRQPPAPSTTASRTSLASDSGEGSGLPSCRPRYSP
jgi:integrase